MKQPNIASSDGYINCFESTFNKTRTIRTDATGMVFAAGHIW
jgi:hypothetical protein